jgi:hypothetical protein
VTYVSVAVEGISDEAVLRRLVTGRNAQVCRVQVQHGKPNLRRALPGYNAATQRSPWVVLVDLDQDFECPAALIRDWLPAPSRHMCLRVAVRQIESWLLGDIERFARCFRVPQASVPRHPDDLSDAKDSLLALVAQSRRRDVREDMLPRPRSGRRVGRAYTSRLIEFASDVERGWRPEVAAQHSPSLARCLKRLDALIQAAP